jgi:hypothetical protein
VWDLKAYLKRGHGITTAVQLQAYIESTVGVTVTVQTLRSLLRSPLAPRKEMIQLLCDVFNCRSDAFYLVTPNPERAKQWEQDRIDGKKPSALYQPKVLDRVEESAVATCGTDAPVKPECLRTTYTDPRLFYRRRISERRNERAAS